jgi:hypothetical protein
MAVHQSAWRSAVPVLAKWAILLGGIAYTGFVTRLFEREFGWHLAPIGLLMLFGSSQVAEWTERRLAARLS